MQDCPHAITEIRWRNRGINMIGRQCLHCGKAVGQWIPHAELPQDKTVFRDWDDAITERYWRGLRRARLTDNGQGGLF